MTKDRDISWNKDMGNTMLNLADNEWITFTVKGKNMIIMNNSKFNTMKEELPNKNKLKSRIQKLEREIVRKKQDDVS